jgi:diguanylate cyclase (GGDEF)-like protein
MRQSPPDKRRPNLPNVAIRNEGELESTQVTAAPNVMRSRTRRDRPYLIVIGGTSVGEMFPLRAPEVIIGRAHDATVRFDDEGVSRRHARLRCNDTEVHIEDLGSVNGTFVNGDPLVRARLLADGDKITLGPITILKFTYSDDLDETFQRRMFEASLLDGLTKAYNKSYFLDRLEKEVAYARRHSTPLSLVMLDIDFFKRINDTYGHPAGDAVLVQVAGAALDSLRKEDVFARYGGEEFAVICRGLDVSQARLVAERLRGAVAATRTSHAGLQLAVTVSLGVAGLIETKAQNGPELVGAADQALYGAKKSGRNRVLDTSEL